MAIPKGFLPEVDQILEPIFRPRNDDGFRYGR
jgi:hypothetical protein